MSLSGRVAPRAGGPLADRIVTTSPDVTVSTNLGGWVNRRGLFSMSSQEDVFRDRGLMSPQKWAMSPKGQHFEQWHHSQGCRRWFNAERDTVTYRFKQFYKLHPTHKHVQNGWCAYMSAVSAYMNAPEGMALLPPHYQRDQAQLQEALVELAYFFDHYSGSSLEPLAIKLRDEIKRRLLQHELYVARFYLDREVPEAAIGRLEAAHKNYPGIGLDAEVLFLLGLTYLRMDEVELSRSTFSELQSQHPRHHHGRQARQPAGTGAHHHHRCRQRFEFEDAVGIEHAVVVERHAVGPGRHGAGGQHDVAAAHRAQPGASRKPDGRQRLPHGALAVAVARRIDVGFADGADPGAAAALRDAPPGRRVAGGLPVAVGIDRRRTGLLGCGPYVYVDGISGSGLYLAP